MKSELTDLYKEIIKKDPYFFSNCKEDWLSEMIDYIKYNSHNVIIEHRDNKIIGINFSNGTKSDIIIDPFYVSMIENKWINYESKYAPSEENNLGGNDRVAFLININSVRGPNIITRLNNIGFFLEMFSHNPENFNKNYNVKTYIYDWGSIPYIQNNLGKFMRERKTEINELFYHLDFRIGFSSLSPESILNYFKIEPDATIEFNSNPLTCTISNTLMKNQKEFEIEKYSEDDSFYATYMQFMINEGYYIDRSLEMQIKQKNKTYRRKENE